MAGEEQNAPLDTRREELNNNCLTPLAGRVVLGKKEAVTSAISVIILLNIFILLIVQVALSLLPSNLDPLFWVLLVLLLGADGALSPMCFHFAVKEVEENNAAYPYTVAEGSGGTMVIYHRDGRTETFLAKEVTEVHSKVTRLSWNSLAGPSRGYGSVYFTVRSQLNRVVIYKVNYVVNCVKAADFSREFIASVKAKEREAELYGEDLGEFAED